MIGNVRARPARKPARDERPYALPRILQQQHHQNAEDDHFEVAVLAEQLRQQRLQVVLQHRQDGRAKHRAPHVRHAADHRHEQELDAVIQAERRRIHRALQMCVEKAGNRGQHRRINEDHDAHPCGIHAHRFRHRAAAAQRANRASGPTIKQIHDPDQVVDVPARLQIDAEHVEHGNAVDAVVLAEHLQIAEQKEQRETPRDRPERQKVARQPHRHRAEHQRDQRGQHDADDQREPRRHTEVRRQIGGRISADADERRLPEARHAADAGQQHEPDGDDRIQPDVVQQRDPVLGHANGLRQHGQREHHHEEQPEEPVLYDPFHRVTPRPLRRAGSQNSATAAPG